MTDATLQPNMELVGVPGAISGTAIIDDLLNRIGERLSRDCALRETDAYQGYSATVQINLQLADVYPVEVAAQVAVGTVDAAQPSTRIAMNVTADVVTARAGTEPSLERFIEGDAGAPAEAPAPQRRQYVSRLRGAKR
jgi:hypothetical protein